MFSTSAHEISREARQQQSLHNGERSAVLLCSLPHTITDFVPDLADSIVLRSSIALASESLEESAVYTVLRHPIEVPIITMNPGTIISWTLWRSNQLGAMRSDLSTVFWFLEENK